MIKISFLFSFGIKINLHLKKTKKKKTDVNVINIEKKSYHHVAWRCLLDVQNDDSMCLEPIINCKKKSKWEIKPKRFNIIYMLSWAIRSLYSIIEIAISVPCCFCVSFKYELYLKKKRKKNPIKTIQRNEIRSFSNRSKKNV